MRDMTALAPFEADVDPRRVPLDVEIVVPVYNEAAQLEERITALRTFLDTSFPFRALVTVVDNASTDDTAEVAADLAARMRGVAAMHLPRKGRGYALREAWSTSDAPVVAYMDVDLSTSLPALLPLVAPLLSGHRDVAIGSRLALGAHVVRGPKRELISRAYNLLLKLTLRGRFSDAQCGFKALRRDAARSCCPSSRTTSGSSTPSCWSRPSGWVCASARSRSTGSTIPIRGSTSSRPPRTTCGACGGCWCGAPPACGGSGPTRWRPTSSCASPGSACSPRSGTSSSSSPGDRSWARSAPTPSRMAIATLFNTAVHRELSRSTDGQARRGRLLAVAGGLYVLSLGLTTLGLLVAQWLAPSALLPELVAITVANLVAAVFRFAVLRAWIFRPGTRAGSDPMEESS